MSDLVPFLRIVHISDLHLIHNFVPPHTTSHAISFMRFINRTLASSGLEPYSTFEEYEEGLGGHVETSISKLSDMFKTLSEDNKFSNKTWLIDTGDISSYGDKSSLNRGKKILENLAKNLGNNIPVVSIYGNHDAWPESHPITEIFSNEQTISHRNNLREEHFIENYPCEISHGIPESDLKIRCYKLNSVLHGRRNIWAEGEIQHDKWWKTEESPATDEQIRILHEIIASNSSPGDLRIILSHHPILQPEVDRYQLREMKLINRKIIADHLKGIPGHTELGTLGNLILSGHTHRVFPNMDEECYTRPMSLTDPMSDGKIFQLVAGSPFKKGPIRKKTIFHKSKEELFASEFPHTFQVLRIFLDKKDNKFVLNRHVCGRLFSSAGKYYFPYNKNILRIKFE